MWPLISIIVPVYRVEKYLAQCVNSILQQTYENLEIILVDDGSPDSCGVMCDEFANKDKRVITIHKENGGLSDARNSALDIMKGEFVTFIDSDDFVSKYYIENLYNALDAGKADMSISWFENVFEGETIKNISSNEIGNSLKSYTAADCLKKMLYQDGAETTAWGKLYKKEHFLKLRYPKGKLYEDIPVTFRTIHACTRIAIIDNVDYYYFQRKNSIQYESFKPAKMDAVIHMKELMDFIMDVYPELSIAAKCRYFSTTCNILFQIKKSEYEKERMELWNEVKRLRRAVLFDKEGRGKARLGAFLSYFGYPIMKNVYCRTQWRG